ncbi:U3 small nucleolar RNA-associated protein 6-domain-containing protein [Glomus cerebriforme]|uniref:U3 small nucleolar RNA-associated protein 6-domain-containing protein n=1 Tax=Glomus cerebriforme TaxID=658196 RepID=A0A397TLV4_9GLOM|nr:U3 small nucleolar RNA-associated protein 6-domain-containing protein [Glomus cerebriforme]
MAETVQYYLEQMVPELEDLEHKEIFTKEEIKSIVKKRTNFEYALKRRPAQIIDFLKYIEYEMNLDLLRKKRKGRLGIKGKVTISDYSIKRRIYHIFDRTIIKFAGDVKLWLQYIDFAKNEGDDKVLSKIFGSVLQLHPTKPIFWIMASKYEFEVNANIMSARVILQRGLRLNRDSHQLWHQYFKLELIYVEKIKARRKILGISNSKVDEPNEEQKDSQNFIKITDDDEFSKAKKLELEGLDNLPKTILDDDNLLLCGEIAKVVYFNAIKAVPNDLSFRKGFIDICREFSNANMIQEEIYKSIQKDFENSSEALSYVAERHVANISDVQSIEFIDAIKNSINEFQKCIEKLPNNEMWYTFSKMLLKHSRMVSEPNLIAFLNKKLLKTYKTASESNLASSQMYLDWINWILEKESNKTDTMKMKELLKKATDTWPNSSKLWERRITLNINEEKESKNDSIEELYKLALKSNPASLILWDSYLSWTFKKFKNGDLEDFELEKLLLNSISKISSLSRSTQRNNEDDDHQPNEVKDQITTRYLKWAVEKGGLDNARKVYKSLFNKTLSTLKFYQTCIEIEKEYLEGKSHPITSDSQSHLIWLYEQACGFEGAPSDLWLDFIQFHLNNKEIIEASDIYWKALKCIKDPESFEAKYRQMMYQFNNQQKKQL